MNTILQKTGDFQKEKLQKQVKIRKSELEEYLQKLVDKNTFCFFLRNGVKYFGRIHPEKGDIRLPEQL